MKRIFSVSALTVLAGLLLLCMTPNLSFAQVPIGDTRSGTLTVDGVPIAGTNSNYVIKVTDAAGNEFTDSMGFKFSEILTGGVSSSSIGAIGGMSGLYFYTIPIYKLNVQPLGAVAGSTAYIRVFFQGNQLRVTTPVDGALTVTEGASNYNFNVVAAAARPDITITGAPVNTLDFGRVKIGSTLSKTITVKNTGDSGTTLTVSGMGITSGSCEMAFTRILPIANTVNLAKDASGDIVIQFAPTTRESYSGTLTLTTNVPGKETIQVALTGTGGVLLSLKAGWNLVSLMAPPQNTGIGSVLNGIKHRTSTVFAFDRAFPGNWKSAVYNAGTGNFQGVLTTMETGNGYWIYVTQDIDWEY